VNKTRGIIWAERTGRQSHRTLREIPRPVEGCWPGDRWSGRCQEEVGGIETI